MAAAHVVSARRLAEINSYAGHSTLSDAPGPSELEARLAEVNPDELTPKAALELLYELRALLKG